MGASECRLTHSKATNFQLTILRAFSFICFFTEVRREYITTEGVCVSAPDLRNVVTEVVRQGCIVAKPGQASEEGELGGGVTGPALVFRCRLEFGSLGPQTWVGGGKGTSKKQLRLGIKAGSVAHLVPRRVSLIARPSVAYPRETRIIPGADCRVILSPPTGAELKRFRDSYEALKAMRASPSEEGGCKE